MGQLVLFNNVKNQIPNKEIPNAYFTSFFLIAILCDMLNKAAPSWLPVSTEQFPAIFTCGIVTGGRGAGREIGTPADTHCGEAESQSLRGRLAAQCVTMSKPKSLNTNTSAFYKQTTLWQQGVGLGLECRNKDVAEGGKQHLPPFCHWWKITAAETKPVSQNKKCTSQTSVYWKQNAKMSFTCFCQMITESITSTANEGFEKLYHGGEK